MIYDYRICVNKKSKYRAERRVKETSEWENLREWNGVGSVYTTYEEAHETLVKTREEDERIADENAWNPV